MDLYMDKVFINGYINLWMPDDGFEGYKQKVNR